MKNVMYNPETSMSTIQFSFSSAISNIQEMIEDIAQKDTEELIITNMPHGKYAICKFLREVALQLSRKTPTCLLDPLISLVNFEKGVLRLKHEVIEEIRSYIPQTKTV